MELGRLERELSQRKQHKSHGKLSLVSTFAVDKLISIKDESLSPNPALPLPACLHLLKQLGNPFNFPQKELRASQLWACFLVSLAVSTAKNREQDLPDTR